MRTTWDRIDAWLRSNAPEVCQDKYSEPTRSRECDHNPSGIYDSPETALREAERQFLWLKVGLQQEDDLYR